MAHTGTKPFASTADPIYQRWLAWIDAGAPYSASGLPPRADMASRGAARHESAETLTLTFTTSASPSAGGSPFDPKNVVAVWIEGPAGTFVKTVGRWANTRRTKLVSLDRQGRQRRRRRRLGRDQRQLRNADGQVGHDVAPDAGATVAGARATALHHSARARRQQRHAGGAEQRGHVHASIATASRRRRRTCRTAGSRGQHRLLGPLVPSRRRLHDFIECVRHVGTIWNARCYP